MPASRRPLPIDDDHAPLFTVGQVADMLGLHQSFLRRLDEHRIVTPARSSGGQRRYTRHEVETVGQVLDLIAEGLTLTGVRRVLELQDEVGELRRQLADVRSRPGER